MEQLFKYEHKIYTSIEYKSSLPIELKDNMVVDDSNYIFLKNSTNNTYFTKDGKCFLKEKTHKDEETFVKNYGNPLYHLYLRKYLWVVEKKDDKVCLKSFNIESERRVGKRYFTKKKNLTYVTLNLKTGDYYVGSIMNYQKKRKCSKKIRKNYFSYDSLSGMKSEMKNILNYLNIDEDAKQNLPIQYINAFISQIYGHVNRLDESPFSKVLRFYLTKKNVKYPDNFNCFYNNEHESKNITLKYLRKSNLNLVDTFMSMNDIRGKKIKKCLHYTNKLNLKVLKNAIKIFGEDWVNQDEEFIMGCLNSPSVSHHHVIDDVRDYFSKPELKRAFIMYKNVCMYENIGLSGFHDHLTFYTQLKDYGEPIKWMSSNDAEFFHKEHLDWVDKLDHYRRGIYKRMYPNYMYDMFKDPIKISDDIYHIVLLNDTTSYNEESQTQSNCVKGYIGRAESIIFSIRKDTKDSKERATIEYVIRKNNEDIKVSRIQSLGRFNGMLDDSWNSILTYLDNKINSIPTHKNFETVKIEKECKNGVKFFSNSDWSEKGILFWTYNKITQNEYYIW